MDSHCHHYRLVQNCGVCLLVRHGGGDERIHLSLPRGSNIESSWRMDSNTRYWILNAIYHAHSNGRRDGIASEAAKYLRAFAEGRLKKRKLPKQGTVRIWIEAKEVA
jgi:hypothetical protein